MDWASSQWKEGLSSVALQKVNALEASIEKLQKERQQKQLQFECLELTLNKEKRKVEEGKQHNVDLERELQSLAEVCKNLENKHQKLQGEIQNRDSRINNLESQLSQSKKQNSRLQQLEKDIEDLRYVRDNSKLENKELEEKLKQEQNVVVKQSDAISELEETIKVLQDKYSNDKSSNLINDLNKENITLNESSFENSSSNETLRKKVLEQENLIKSLRAQIETVVDPSNDSFRTPSKSKCILTESTRKSYSFWDNFGFTTPKETKVSKHINESSTFDESDEKIRMLNQKIKQLSQELECQRHNSEAAKNAMEQRLKEKENALKDEVKQLSQTISDQDRDLKELRSKYQQDVTQANKKLDVVNMQQQKTEVSKQQLEKDMKALELQVNFNNVLLSQKEEELKDLQKQKSSAEMITKGLQSEKRELERNLFNLQAEKKSLTEENRDVKLKLDGSNNLVTEKEALIQNMKKDNEYALKIKSELEIKIQAVSRDFSLVQSEKTKLEKQLQDLDASFLAAKENIEVLKTEKKNGCNLFDLEKSKNNKLENDVLEKKKELSSLQTELKSSEQNCITLKKELEELKNNSTLKTKNLEQELSKFKEEKYQLETQIQAYTDNEKSMKENISKIKIDFERVAESLSIKTSECEILSQNIEKLEKQLLSVQNDNESRNKAISDLTADIESKKKAIQELENRVTELTAETELCKNQLNESSQNEIIMKENMKKLEEENGRISALLESQKNEKNAIESKIQAMNLEFGKVQSEYNLKLQETDNIQKDFESTKASYDLKIIDLQQSLSTAQAEKKALDLQVEDLTSEKQVLEGNLKQEQSNSAKLLKSVENEVNKNMKLEISLAELKANLDSLQSEITHKNERIVILTTEVETLTSEKHSLEENLKQEQSKSENILKSIEHEAIKSKNVETELKANLEHLHAEITQEKERIVALSTDIATLMSEKHLLEEKVKQEQLNSKNMLKSIEDETKKNKKHEIRIEELEANLEHFHLELAQEKDRILVLSTEIENLTSEKHLLEQNIKQEQSNSEKLLKCIDDKTSKNKKLETELKVSLEHLHSELAQKNERIVAFSTEVETLTSEKSFLAEKLKQEQLKSENILKSVDDESNRNKKLEITISELKLNLDHLHTEITHGKERIVALSTDIQTLSSEKHLLEENLKLEQTNSEKILKSIEDESKKSKKLETELKVNLEHLHSELQQKKEIIMALGTEVENLKSEKNLLEQNLKQEQSKSENILKSIEDETNQNKILEININELKSNLDNLHLELAQGKERMMVLTAEVKNLTSEKHLLEENLKQEQSNVEKMLKSIEDKTNKNKKLETELKVSLNHVHSELAQKKERIVALGAEVENLTSEKNLLEEKLKQEQSNYEKKLKSIEEETGKNKIFEITLTEMRTTLESLQSELTQEREKIKKYENDVSKTTEFHDNQVKELKKEIEDYSTQQSSLADKIRETTAEKKEIELLLKEEKDKSESLSCDISNLNMKIQNLESELNTTKDAWNSYNSDIDSCKKNYELKLQELQDSIFKLDTENENLSNQVKIMAMDKDDLLQKINILENANRDFVQKLSSMITRTEILETDSNELKNRMVNYSSELFSKEEEISALKSEIEDSRKYFEDERASYIVYVKNLESNLFKVQGILLRISVRSHEINKEIAALKEEHLDKEAGDEASRLGFLYSLLNQLDSIEKITESYEDERTNCVLHVKNLESSLLQAQESLMKISICSDEINKENITLKEECLAKDDQVDRLEFLCSLLNKLDSIEKMTEVMTAEYEKNLSELEKHYALEKSQVFLLQDKVFGQVAELKEKMAELEIKDKKIAHLTCQERNLIENISNLKKSLNNKDISIENLSSEISSTKAGYLETVGKLENQLSIAVAENEMLTSKYDKVLSEKSELEEQVMHYEANKDVGNDALNKVNELNFILCQLENENQKLHVQKEETIKMYGYLLANLKREQEVKLEKLDDQLSEVVAENEMFTSKFNKLLSEKSELERQISHYKANSHVGRDAVIKMNEWKFILCQLENENQNLHVQKEETIKMYTSLMANIKKEQENSIDVTQKVSKTDISEISVLTSKLDSLAKENIELTKHLDNYKVETKKYINELQGMIELKHLLSHLNNENQILYMQKEELAKMFKHLVLSITENNEETVGKLKCHLSQALAAKENLVLKYDVLSVEKSKLEEQISNYEANACVLPIEDAINMHSTFDSDCSGIDVFAGESVIKLFCGVHSSSVDLLTKIYSLQENVLKQKEHFKFLLDCHLIDSADMRKMFLLLKFLKKTCSRADKIKSALVSLRDLDSHNYISDRNLCWKLFRALNSLACTFNEKVDCEFLKQSMLINSNKNLYIISKFQKTLHLLDNQINIYSQKFERYFKNFLYQNVHCNSSHLPAIPGSKHIVCLNKINCPACKKYKFKRRSLKKEVKPVFYIDNLLCGVAASKIPTILNCVFRLSENNLFSNSDYSCFNNIVCFILEMLIASYKGETSCLSSCTVNYLEKSLHSLTHNSLEHNSLIEISKALFSLLHDLRSSFMSKELLSLEKTSQLQEARNKVNELQLECDDKQQQLTILHNNLAAVQEKLLDLNKNIGNVEDARDEALLAQKKCSRKLVNISNIFSTLNVIFSGECDATKLQLEAQNLSDDICLCHACVVMNQEDEIKDHTFTSPLSLYNNAVQLLELKIKYEKEVNDLKKNESNLKTDIEFVENERNVLEETVKDLEEVKSLVDQELEDFKIQYDALNKEFQTAQKSVLESNTKQENLLQLLKSYEEDIGKCKNDYSVLLANHQKLEHDLAAKRLEISDFEKCIQEKTAECRDLDVACDEYEEQNERLNCYASKLLVEVSENRKNASNVDELENKISSLQESNKLLNITLENVEEELQGVYGEKQRAEEELQVKVTEIENLVKEIKSWKNTVNDKEERIVSLESSIKELETSYSKLQVRLNELQNLEEEIQLWKDKVNSEKVNVLSLETSFKELEKTHFECDKKYSELCLKNIALQKDITYLKGEQKNQRVIILENNFCLKEKNMMISQLKEKISENLKEKEIFEKNLADIESNYVSELNAKSNILEGLKCDLNLALNQKLQLEEKVKQVLSDNAHLRIILEDEFPKVNYKELASENVSLKDNLESLAKEKLKVDNELQILKKNITYSEDQLSTLQEELQKEKESSQEVIKTLKDDLKCEKQSNSDFCALIQELQQNIASLEKVILKNEKATKEIIEDLSSKNCILKEEIDSLNSQLTFSCNYPNVPLTETQHSGVEDDYRKCVTTCTNILSEILTQITCNSSSEREKKKNLLSMLMDWEKHVNDLNFSDTVYEELKVFFKSQHAKQENLELEIAGMVNPVCDFIKKIGDYCAAFDDKKCNQSEFSSIFNQSCLNASRIITSGEVETDFSTLTDEVKKSMKLLEECFSTLQDHIAKKELEIKSLKKSLVESREKLVAAPHDTNQTLGIKALENKISLLKMNGHRLEKSNNKLIKTCEEMEAKIKQLEERVKQMEQENGDLEAEANEMADIIRNQSVPEELAEAYSKLTNATTELRKLSEENSILKSHLEHCKVLLKEHCKSSIFHNKAVNLEQGSSSQNTASEK